MNVLREYTKVLHENIKHLHEMTVLLREFIDLLHENTDLLCEFIEKNPAKRISRDFYIDSNGS